MHRLIGIYFYFAIVLEGSIRQVAYADARPLTPEESQKILEEAAKKFARSKSTAIDTTTTIPPYIPTPCTKKATFDPSNLIGDNVSSSFMESETYETCLFMPPEQNVTTHKREGTLMSTDPARLREICKRFDSSLPYVTNSTKHNFVREFAQYLMQDGTALIPLGVAEFNISDNGSKALTMIYDNGAVEQYDLRHFLDHDEIIMGSVNNTKNARLFVSSTDTALWSHRSDELRWKVLLLCEYPGLRPPVQTEDDSAPKLSVNSPFMIFGCMLLVAVIGCYRCIQWTGMTVLLVSIPVSPSSQVWSLGIARSCADAALHQGNTVRHRACVLLQADRPRESQCQGTKAGHGAQGGKICHFNSNIAKI